MLEQGKNVYLLLPGAAVSERLLYKGVVTECNAETFVAQFEDSLSPTVGGGVLVHAEVNRKFMQQGATVQAILQSFPKYVIGFARVGEPISAENRNAFRVSIAAQQVPATVDKDAACQLVDVSATGFGVFSSSKWSVGDTVSVELSYAGITCAGQARIQAARPLGGSQIRYGLHAIEGKRGTGKTNLQAGLGQISAAVQREQLRRLARA